MSIRQKLLANIVLTLVLFLACAGAWFWGSRQYLQFQDGVGNSYEKVQAWLTLNFQVSQYMNRSTEAILTRKKISEDSIYESTGAIIHTFIRLEKATRKVLPNIPAETQQEERLIQAREQFGKIQEELEQALALLNQGKAESALQQIRTHIIEVGLDKEFIKTIELALEHVKRQEARIIKESDALGTKLARIFVILVLGCSGLSLLLLNRINRSIQKSILTARTELLRGTELLGHGTLDTTISINTNDELSIVGDAFNKMAKDLRASAALIEQQQNQLVNSSKMSALGEMAGGVAHEINNPLAIIAGLSDQMQEMLLEEPMDKVTLIDMLQKMQLTIARIAKIITGLRTFSRDGSQDSLLTVNACELVEDTLSFCRERFKLHNIKLSVESTRPDLTFKGRSVEVSQVLLNLLNNAHDAIAAMPEKWVSIKITDENEFVLIRVTDSGNGIAPGVREKIFQPFFTTKEIGQGTGMGLSISMGIIKSLKGELKLDANNPHTSFLVRLPKA